jgi:nucleoside-diphosphate-sugar epimerase
VAEADVVVHLAYLIVGSREESQRINLAGTRNVVEATVSADRPRRLVYTSSLAAYGYHADNPVPLTEDVPARGSPEHYYSAQKAACEALLRETTAGAELQVYVLRPCIVAGPEATLLVRSLPWRRAAERLPEVARRMLGRVPGLPVLPDPGVRFQLVHHDDVATAVCLAVIGAGSPGAYNLAGDGEVTASEFARALGGYAIPVPGGLVGLTSKLVERLPFLPAELEWVHAARHPMLMDTTKARRQLGWAPARTAHETLAAMVDAERDRAAW